MELIYENNYVVAFYYPDLSLIFYHWQEANIDMTEQEYKDTMLGLLSFVQKYHPTTIITDFRKSEFLVIPELQIWLSEHIVKPAIAAGMRKLFFIARSSDFIQELSLEQILDEAKDQEFQRFILHDIDTAMQFVKLKSDPQMQE